MRKRARKAFRPTPSTSCARCSPFSTTWKSADELRRLTAWKAHTLTGDRKGTWSLSVTRNRRLTFRIDAAEREVWDVNLEDYH